jgi:CheY-like chemotaxis protein
MAFLHLDVLGSQAFSNGMPYRQIGLLDAVSSRCRFVRGAEKVGSRFLSLLQSVSSPIFCAAIRTARKARFLAVLRVRLGVRTSSGLEAIALIEAGEIVDAMVSDLSMPGINGVTTIRKVRELRPQLPCFLLTGYIGERAALGVEDTFTLVRKPVSGRALAAQIEAGLEGAKR